MVSKDVIEALKKLQKNAGVLLLSVDHEKRMPWQLRQLKMVKK